MDVPKLGFVAGASFTKSLQSSALRAACGNRNAMHLRRPRRCKVHMTSAPGDPQPPQPPQPPQQTGPFGIRLQTNGDVLKFGIGAIVLGYGVKEGLQLCGIPDLMAGQLTTGILSVASLIAWVSTYVFRVGTKSMTYAQQLKDYEDAVIAKRYEELTEEELVALSEELEDDL